MNVYTFLIAGLLLTATAPACEPIKTAIDQELPDDLQKIEVEVAKDVDNGLSLPEIVLDLAKMGVADALKVAYDVIVMLLDSTHLTPQRQARLENLHVDAANAMRAAGKMK